MSVISSLLGTVTAPIQPYLLAIKVGAIVAAVVLIAFLGWRDHSLGQQVGALKVTLAQAKVDNQADERAIATLAAANKEWVAKDAANQEKIDGLASQISDQQHSLDADRKALLAAQHSESTPAAVGLRSTRIDDVDPALAGRLRNESLSH